MLGQNCLNSFKRKRYFEIAGSYNLKESSICHPKIFSLVSYPSPTSSFVFFWRWYLKWWLWPFQGVTLFSWVSPMYTRGIHVLKLLVINLYFISWVYEPRPWRVNKFSSLKSHRFHILKVFWHITENAGYLFQLWLRQ